MATTWDITIIPIDVKRKEASIIAIYTDDADPLNILTEKHVILSALLDTQQQKLDVLDNIWQLHLSYQAKEIAIKNFIGTLEADAKTNLEARE